MPGVSRPHGLVGLVSTLWGRAPNLLNVGGIARAAQENGVLARVGWEHELHRAGAADVAWVGVDTEGFEPHTGEDAVIGLSHLFVAGVEAGLVFVEGVGVLH